MPSVGSSLLAQLRQNAVSMFGEEWLNAILKSKVLVPYADMISVKIVHLTLGKATLNK